MQGKDSTCILKNLSELETKNTATKVASALRDAEKNAPPNGR